MACRTDLSWDLVHHTREDACVVVLDAADHNCWTCAKFFAVFKTACLHACKAHTIWPLTMQNPVVVAVGFRYWWTHIFFWQWRPPTGTPLRHNTPFKLQENQEKAQRHFFILAAGGGGRWFVQFIESHHSLLSGARGLLLYFPLPLRHAWKGFLSLVSNCQPSSSSGVGKKKLDFLNPMLSAWENCQHGQCAIHRLEQFCLCVLLTQRFGCLLSHCQWRPRLDPPPPPPPPPRVRQHPL